MDLSCEKRHNVSQMRPELCQGPSGGGSYKQWPDYRPWPSLHFALWLDVKWK